MAQFYGANYTDAYVDVPSEKVKVNTKHGRIRILTDSIALGAELSISDKIAVGKLPTGARVVYAKFQAPSDGTTGQYDFGWQSNGTDAADADGFFAGATLDTGGGAIDATMAGTAPAFLKEFAAETILELNVVEATTASNGDTLKWVVLYVVD